MRDWLLRRGGLLGLGVLGFYVAAACPYVVEIDTAEFATLGAAGGGAHPSGYPLYVLWLRAWSWLPVDTPAHAAAIATAVLGAASVVVLHAACRAWGARPLAATVAAGLFAVAPLVARYHTIAEAFALNHLVVATVLWLAAAGGPLRGRGRALALGLVAGLGLANHLTCALVAPVGLLGVGRAAREARPGPALALAGAGLVAGLVPYLYLFVAPEHALAWPRPGSLAELADIVLRREYGGAFSFTSGEGDVPVIAHLGALAASLGRAWLWLPALLAIATLAARCARASEGPGAGEPRLGWRLLAASLLLAGPLLATRFATPTNWVGLYIVHRFHLVPILLLAIPLAVGLDGVLARLRVPAAWPAGAAVVLLVGLAVVTRRDLARFHSPAMERAAENTLRTLPPDSVVLGVADELHVAMHYVTLARGERPDVTIRRVDHYARIGADWPPVALVAARPVFVHPFQQDLLARFPHHRHGILVRLLPPGTPPPSLEAVLAVNLALFDRFDLDYPWPGPDDEHATRAHQRYAAVWEELGRALAAAGRPDDAARARALAARLGHTRPE